MNKLFVLILLSSIISYSQWLIKSPLPTYCQSICYPSASVGWVTGGGGIVIKTTDGGSNWLLQQSGTSKWLFSIHFSDTLHGAAAGEAGTIIRTTDGGQNWITQISGTTNHLRRVRFVDSFDGIAVGEGGVILKTEDGGNNWLQQNSGTQRNLYAISFIDNNNAFVSGDYGTILKTTNGGNDWIFLPQNVITYLDIYASAFADGNTGIFVGKQGYMLKTTDGGISFTSSSTNWNANLWDIQAIDANTYVTAGAVGLVFESTNGGLSWTRIIGPAGLIELWGVAAIDGGNYTIVGEHNFIWKRVNNSWVHQSYATDNKLNSVVTLNNGIALAVGKNGVILKSTDRGNSWTKLHSPTVKHLNSIFFYDQVNGTIVGDSATILRTTDGGNTWTFQTSPLNVNLKDVFFTTLQKGIIAGMGGSILRTTDGGNNWEITYNNPASGHFVQVEFADLNTGIVIGDENNGPLKTTNGGQTWISQNSGYPMRGISMLDTSLYIAIGWEYGIGYEIVITSNGGSNWAGTHIPIGAEPNAISFNNPSHNGYIVANDGIVLRSTDGGFSWLRDTVQINIWIDSPYLNAISFFNDAEALIVGNGGIILRTENAGIPVEMITFDAVTNGNLIRLTWSTATELNNRGFEVERKNNDKWRTLAFISGQGTASEIHNYSYVDNISDLNGLSALHYRLKQVDYDGSFEYSKEIEVTFASEYNLDLNYPNPFNPSTTFSYSIPEYSNVVIKVFDILGNEIETLVDEEKPSGKYEVVWNAANLPSGVYFYQLIAVSHGRMAASFNETKKMILIK